MCFLIGHAIVRATAFVDRWIGERGRKSGAFDQAYAQPGYKVAA